MFTQGSGKRASIGCTTISRELQKEKKVAARKSTSVPRKQLGARTDATLRGQPRLSFRRKLSVSLIRWMLSAVIAGASLPAAGAAASYTVDPEHTYPSLEFSHM